MIWTVLGKSPSWQDAGGACSGHLVTEGGAAVLLDCGSGVFGKLRAVRDYVDVDAVVVSHLHADHVLDLVPFASALTYGPRARTVRPRLVVPPGGRDALRRLSAAAGMGADHVDAAFAVEEYDPAARTTVGPLRLAFRLVPHFLPTHAIDVAADGGGRLTYGADCGPGEDLVAFATGTNLLVLEATLTEPAEGHLTPAQAGEHARRAGAGRLVLTHRSDELDAAAAAREATAAFGAPVQVAREGDAYAV